MRDQLTNHTDLLDRILRVSSFTGRFAQQLARKLDLVDEWTRLSFSVGLIHAMGRLVLLHAAPDPYGTLADEQDAPLPAADDEHRLFGESHRTLALRDLAGDPFALPQGLSALEAFLSEELMAIAAEDAADYAANLGGL